MKIVHSPLINKEKLQLLPEPKKLQKALFKNIQNHRFLLVYQSPKLPNKAQWKQLRKNKHLNKQLKNN